MAHTNNTNSVSEAAAIMQRFASRTSIGKRTPDAGVRYLWTDAFAVLNFLALGKIENTRQYEESALQLIADVHHVLGKFAPADERTGWISGLHGEEAEQHPTIAGLRIGKNLPEREAGEPYDQTREWDRDGQYYHYHTRWITALLKAGSYFGEQKFLRWAGELSLAGARFIDDKGGHLKMYWKMSVDLSRPLVPVMGAHDPLEGLICALQASGYANDQEEEFECYIKRLERLCSRSDWATDDALGLGGLLLNVVRAAVLQNTEPLPESVQPQSILENAREGLNDFMESFREYHPPTYRLAFRECGLSLGLRTIMGSMDFLRSRDIEPGFRAEILRLPDLIESFWLENKHQEAMTFRNHLDINEVTLASSLLARSEPEIYARV